MTDTEYQKQKEILLKAWREKELTTGELFKRLKELYDAKSKNIDIVEYQSQLMEEVI